MLHSCFLKAQIKLVSSGTLWYNIVDFKRNRRNIMDLILAIVLIVLAFLGGALGGMYLVRKQIEKEFADNPRLNAEAVRTLLSANGQKPSEAKVQQVYHQIIRQQKAALANNKKKDFSLCLTDI